MIRVHFVPNPPFNSIMNEEMTSTRPYLLRAFYEWIVDNNCTPYLLVNAEMENVEVPRQFVNDGKIVLNIAPMAVRDLELGNEWVSFSARFSGTPHHIMVPISATLAIYAKENGQGMIFQPEQPQNLSAPENDGPDNDGAPPPPEPPKPKPGSGGRPTLRRVK